MYARNNFRGLGDSSASVFCPLIAALPDFLKVYQPTPFYSLAVQCAQGAPGAAIYPQTPVGYDPASGTVAGSNTTGATALPSQSDWQAALAPIVKSAGGDPLDISDGSGAFGIPWWAWAAGGLFAVYVLFEASKPDRI